MTGRAGQRRIGPAAGERHGNDGAYHGILKIKTGPSFAWLGFGQFCLAVITATHLLPPQFEMPPKQIPKMTLLGSWGRVTPLQV
jgi:hypothetical protein